MFHGQVGIWWLRKGWTWWSRNDGYRGSIVRNSLFLAHTRLPGCKAFEGYARFDDVDRHSQATILFSREWRRIDPPSPWTNCSRDATGVGRGAGADGTVGWSGSTGSEHPGTNIELLFTFSSLNSQISMGCLATRNCHRWRTALLRLSLSEGHRQPQRSRWRAQLGHATPVVN